MVHRLKIDETRNNNAYGYERSDRTQIFRIFLRQSKRKRKISKYRFGSIEILFKLTIKAVFEDIRIYQH